MRSQTVEFVDGSEVACPECGMVGSFGQHEHERPEDDGGEAAYFASYDHDVMYGTPAEDFWGES